MRSSFDLNTRVTSIDTGRQTIALANGRHVECGQLLLSLLLNDAAALHGDDRVEAVETTAGHRLACDLAIVSIGAAIACDLLAGSDVALEDGWIVIDRLLRTNLANLLAVGNITTFYDPRGSLRSQS
jgi:NADPH-dependent 2,4-dienoyl-CoA reductase/sulfur reductase-like enzyme